MLRIDRESEYRFKQTSAHPDTALLALAAVMTVAGRDHDYEDLAGATGMAWLLAFDQREPCPGRQALAGQTRLLLSAAPAIGVQLRPILDADDCPACPQLADHFRDSFLPLARLAIEHCQPILCRLGWPASNLPDGCDGQWGIVTRVQDDAGLALAGFAVGDSQPRPILSPPAQLLAVESVFPNEPDWDGLLVASLRIARLITSENNTGPHGVAALRAWREMIVSGDDCPACGPLRVDCHQRLAERLYFRRLAGYEFLCRHGQRVPEDVRSACMQLEPLLSRQIELLEHVRRDQLAIMPLSPGRLGAVVDMFDELLELEQELTDVVSSLHGQHFANFDWEHR